MAGELVLVRADRAEPIERKVVEAGGRVVYLARHDRFDAVMVGAADALGYPSEDVFEYDERLARQLREQWDRDGKTDQRLWERARAYRPMNS